MDGQSKERVVKQPRSYEFNQEYVSFHGNWIYGEKILRNFTMKDDFKLLSFKEILHWTYFYSTINLWIKLNFYIQIG